MSQSVACLSRNVRSMAHDRAATRQIWRVCVATCRVWGRGFATSGESGQGYAPYSAQILVRVWPAGAMCIIERAKSPGAALGSAPLAAYMVQGDAGAYVGQRRRAGRQRAPLSGSGSR